MRRPILASFGLITALLAGGCDGEAREVTMRIDHYLEPCDQEKPSFCLRVLDSSDPEIATASTIAGFEHELGFVYDVVVLVDDDASLGEAYDLVDVLHREAAEADERFELELASDYVKRVDDDGFNLVGGLSARCASPEVCSDVARALIEAEPFHVELSHDARGSFVAHAISTDH